MWQKREKNIFIFLAWIITGVVAAVSLSCMLLSGDVSITKFYNVGDVYEIRKDVFQSSIEREGGYQETSGRVVLDNGNFQYGIEVNGNKNKWKYFFLDISELISDSLQSTFSFEKRIDGECLDQEVVHFDLKEGMNLVEVPENSFNVIEINITGERGVSFIVEDMQIRTQEPASTFGQMIFYSILFLGFYIIFSFGIGLLWRKFGQSFDLYSGIEVLQDIYITVVSAIRRIVERILNTEKKKRFVRISAFMMVYLYSVLIDIKGLYYKEFKYHVVVYVMLILIVALTCIEDKLNRVKWNNPLVWSWMILWTFACISDFIVAKEIRYVGYAMLFGWGVFIFVWNNMKKPEQVIDSFVRAMHYFFGIMMFFCLFCRPETEGIRYAGFSKNPSVFALCLGTIWAVCLGELEYRIRNRELLKKIFPYLLEICAVFVFMWKSQSAGPLLCALLLAAIWLVRMILYTRKRDFHKLLVRTMVCAMLLLVPVYGGISIGINYIPQALGTSVNFKGEEKLSKVEFGMVAYAADVVEKVEESRLGQKFSNTTLSGILSGRDYYYRTYLRDMNLFGHKKNPIMWGKRRLPHNAVLGIAHRYGVFSAVPYVLMLLAVIVYTYRHSRKKKPYAAIPFYVCISTIIMSMADNIEQPFVWLPWFGLYILMGSVFVKEDMMISEKE